MTRPVLVAPDKFKGTFTAAEVAAAVATGLRAGGREAVELPVADGGDGTIDVLGGEIRTAPATDPLGRPIEARFSILPDGRGLVEVAEASGLSRLQENERNAEAAWAADTRGTGELIAAAVQAGAREVIVAAGGSATTDGGAGALAALDEAGVRPRLVVASDVRTEWQDAARVFAPQKGADAATVKRLEHRLDELAAAAPRDPRGVLMSGCAGGLGGGLWAYRGARLLSGAALVLDAIGFDSAMRDARFVITGEGRMDAGTVAGKAAGEVATRCRQGGVGCHAVTGVNDLDPFHARLLDLQTITEARTLEELEAAGRALSGR